MEKVKYRYNRWGFVSWLSGIMKSCRWDIGDWWMVIWMGSEGRT